jgi:hypothetical protein
MEKIINAFHKDYVKTYMPEFLTSLRVESDQKKASQNLTKYVEKKRETDPTHGMVHNISKKVVAAHLNRPKEALQKKPKTGITSKAQQSMTMDEVKAELEQIFKRKKK